MVCWWLVRWLVMVFVGGLRCRVVVFGGLMSCGAVWLAGSWVFLAHANCIPLWKGGTQKTTARKTILFGHLQHT